MVGVAWVVRAVKKWCLSQRHDLCIVVCHCVLLCVAVCCCMLFKDGAYCRDMIRVLQCVVECCYILLLENDSCQRHMIRVLPCVAVCCRVLHCVGVKS